MDYSKRRLKLEYAFVRFTIIVLGVLAVLAVYRCLQNADVSYSSLIAAAIFLPAYWADQTLKVIFIYAARGYEALETDTH